MVININLMFTGATNYQPQSELGSIDEDLPTLPSVWRQPVELFYRSRFTPHGTPLPPLPPLPAL